MLRRHRIGRGPAHDALAMRQRVNAEFAEGGVFQFAIGRMIFDPLHVLAELVALMQHRPVPVGHAPGFIERAADETAEPIEMRLDMLEQILRQMNAQQIGQRRIGAIEIHAGRIGRDQIGGNLGDGRS